MNNKYVVIPILSIFVLAIIACSPTEQDIRAPEVISLREYSEFLADESRLWKSDAYLHSVKIDFEENGGRIFAEFRALASNDETLLLVFDPGTKTITKEIFKHDVPIPSHIPILESDWKLDSIDAMKSFLSFDDIRSYLKNGKLALKSEMGASRWNLQMNNGQW